MASDIQQSPFIKQLAANDRPTRDSALLSLQTYLSASSRTLPPLELLKLWKGLFYSMWMCDRPLPQQALASALASLVAILPAHTTIPFLRAFWLTMQREWTGIDVLRMEKFLLLTRRYLAAAWEVMRRSGWEEVTVREGLELLEEIPLNVGEVRVPNGMRYHVIDIYVDELERVGVLSNGDGAAEEVSVEERGELVEKLLAPLKELEKKSPTKTVRLKCKEALADERLPGNRKTPVEPEKGDDEEETWGGIED